MIRPKATVRSNRSSPTKPLAIAQINAGINIIARVVSINSINAKPPKASFAKAEAFSFFSYFFEINGTKAELKAPSAKNLLNIFGSLKAAKKHREVDLRLSKKIIKFPEPCLRPG